VFPPSQPVQPIHLCRTALLPTVRRRPLADEVWAWCEKARAFGRTVTVKIKYADFQQATRSRTLPAVVASQDALRDVSPSLAFTPDAPLVVARQPRGRDSNRASSGLSCPLWSRFRSVPRRVIGRFGSERHGNRSAVKR
jgi:nucleotidyltransferase/DNA polymerase involved in DNA repair